ncbi:MAG: hypothetical protein A2Z83_02570 [Omnitrophica bacterium GWA2_52_8]|nr:MAG: hypothetical protein A2Z83_02570 [Omnitrophica bacterium GWA2_52_8]
MNKKIIYLLLLFNFGAIALAGGALYLNYQTQVKMAELQNSRTRGAAEQTPAGLGTQLGSSVREMKASWSQNSQSLNERAGKTVQDVNSIVRETMEVLKPQLEKAAQDFSKVVGESSKVFNESAQQAAQDIRNSTEHMREAWEKEVEDFNKSARQTSP